MGNELKTLIKRRGELCTAILDITENAGFDFNADDIDNDTERYAELYDRREALVNELNSIHSQIGKDGYEQAKSDAEASRTLTESDEQLKRVMELDKRHKEHGENMHKTALRQIKRINQGRSLNIKYNEKGDTDGHLVDNKN